MSETKQTFRRPDIRWCEACDEDHGRYYLCPEHHGPTKARIVAENNSVQLRAIMGRFREQEQASDYEHIPLARDDWKLVLTILDHLVEEG